MTGGAILGDECLSTSATKNEEVPQEVVLQFYSKDIW